MPKYNDNYMMFRCRFCGSRAIGTGYERVRPYFCCVNEKCRAVVFFELPENATEEEHQKHYLAYMSMADKEGQG